MKWRDINCFAFDRIFAEIFLKNMKKFILMIRVFHIDKINQNDPGEISKSNLTGNFSSSFEIYFTVSLFCFFLSSIFATVDINENKRLRLLDNKKIIENLLIPFHIPTYLQAKTTHWFLAVSINYMKSGQ